MKILSFDIGIASIGWAFVENQELIDCGVRIFTKAENPKNGDSLAAPRREARSARRRLTRRKARLNAIKRLICKEFGFKLDDYLSDDGVLPLAYQTTKDTKNPYELRTLALSQKLDTQDLARVILHIAKHRGYGNKHAKDSNDNETGKVKKAIQENEKALQASQCKSVGEYLYENFYKQNKNVRNKKGNYEHCMAQEQIKTELELIFEKQAEFGAKLSESFKKNIVEVAFYQRPLKGFADKVGKCTFYADEPRAPKDSLSAIEFVALGQIINTLKNIESKTGEIYGKEKIQEILQIVLSTGKITYIKMREILALPENIHFPKGKNLDYTKGNLATQIKSFLHQISKKVKPKENVYIYTKDQEMQIYNTMQESGGISYAKLREILNLEASIKFDDTLLGKRKGLDYTQENIEETIAEIKEKDPESVAFLNFENLTKFRAIFEPKKRSKNISKTAEEEIEESNEIESSNGIFIDLAQHHRDELDNIAQDIANEKDKKILKKKLEQYKVLKGKDAWLDQLSELNFSKHINLSFKALEQILPLMHEGLRYDEAVEKAGLQEHKKGTQKGAFLPPIKDYEPYLANPVVARALSEYRKVCNALLRKYGKVHKIHIELARDVDKSYEKRKKIENEQKENFEKNEEVKKQCEIQGLTANPVNVLKMKLWIEQAERCAYSGNKIKLNDLKDSTMLQIDHIYPYSRSFDDSYMNKVLVFTKENQNKGNRTPYEAFSEDKEKWETIKSFARNFLPQQKYKRIVNENFAEKQNGFKERNLTDTKYIARLALNYTKDNLDFEKLGENECTISGKKNSKVHCEAINGTLTTNLRHIWGFGNKNRDNHLHHAEDAIIIAHTNASMIQNFKKYYEQKNELKSAYYKQQNALQWRLYDKEIKQDIYYDQNKANDKEYKEQKEQFKKKFCLPYGDFLKVVREKVDKVFVSKPPRKKVRGALHEETFYSFDDKKLLKEYGGKKGIQKALKLGKIRQIGTKIVSNGLMIRVDIFKHKQNGKFYAVPIYTMDFALGILPNKAVVAGKDKEGVIKDWLEMDSSYDFCFSLFKDDLILVQKKEMEKAELCYFVSFGVSTASITIEKHNNKFENLSENEKLLYSNATEKEVVGKSIGIQNLKVFDKWQVSPLGEVQKADYAPRQDITLKSSPKRKGN